MSFNTNPTIHKIDVSKRIIYPDKSTCTVSHLNDHKLRVISECSTDHQQEFIHKPKKIAIVMVGLPGRGKTYISKNVARYFNWIGIKTEIFDVNDYRRKLVISSEAHDYFYQNNATSQKTMHLATENALCDLISWLCLKGELAIFDGANTTREKREMVFDLCTSHNIEVIFLECLSDDSESVKNHILQMKYSNPECIEKTDEEIFQTFEERLKHYETSYQPLELEFDKNMPFICMFNNGSKYLINKVHGNLQSRFIYYLMNISLVPRTIYICRVRCTLLSSENRCFLLKAHGESELNVLGKLGGNSSITKRGQEFAQKLGTFFNGQEIPDFKVWISQMKRTHQTTEFIKCNHIEQWKALNEIDSGNCEEMTYEEFQNHFPVEFARRDQDKFHVRFPMGESYQDVKRRLEPVIMELEHQHNVLVICHQAVARCLLAYLLDRSDEELPYLTVPLHTILKLTPTAHKCNVEEISFNVDAVDTHRAKPSA